MDSFKNSDLGINGLRSNLLSMAGLVERSVEEACQGIMSRDASCFDKVEAFEVQINRLHIEIDEMCLEFMALRAPLASDLRQIMVISKINTDLERMGDQAVNISREGKDLLESGQQLNMNNKLDEMIEKTMVMIRDSIDAFVRKDVDLSNKVLEQDDEVDDLQRFIIREMKKQMHKNIDFIDAGLKVISVARNIERLGDHATNIAEKTIFFATGDDVRHKNNVVSM